MAIDQGKMLQTLFDTLFSAFTSPPPGSDAGSQKNSTFLTLNWPGDAIDISQYAGPWSPTNPEGSMAALENFSRLADRAPSVNVAYSPSSQTVSQIFGNVVQATVVPPKPDPELKKRYSAALAFLTTDGTDYDSDGKKITVQVDSPVYANYKRKKNAYDSAVAGLVANYFKYDMSNPRDQREWSLLGPTFQGKVDMAFDDLNRAQATKVRDMLATLAQSSENQVGLLFQAAKRNFDAYRRLNQDMAEWWPSYASPANWFASSAADDWSQVSVSSSRYTREEHSDFTSYGGSVGARWGLWSGSGGFSRQEGHQSMSEETSDVEVAFKFARVEIERPWLNFLVFGAKGWKTTAYPKGKLSTGTKDQGGAVFPLLPTAFVVARDMTISASWGEKDAQLIEKSLQTRAEVGWGPFRISGSYNTASSDRKYAASFDGTTITSPGLQIIGWINTVVPASPPE